jgi:hypothetical protein
MNAVRNWAASIAVFALVAPAAAQGVVINPRGAIDSTTTKGAPPKKPNQPTVKVALGACPLNFDDPSELKDANTQLAFAGMGKPDAQKKALTKAIEKLSLRPDHYSKNVTGYQFLLGQALVSWSQFPGEAPVVKKGDIGFLGDKAQDIDLLKAADSAFSAVEKAQPACAGETADQRKRAWAPLIRSVPPLLNADKLDSAWMMVEKANVIYRDSPYGPYFAAQILYKKDDYAKASVQYENTVNMATPMLVADTGLIGMASNAAFLAPYTGARAAATMTAADQAVAYKRVATLYSAYLKEYPCAQYAENAASGLLDALEAIGDSAGVRSRLTQMVAETRPCSDIWWYTAAREASEQNMMDLAVQLADKAVAYSPWSAGLGNAAGAYYKAKDGARLLPVAKRLVELAPNLPDNYELQASAYQQLADKATAPAVKQAYRDSLVLIYTKGTKVEVKVRVSQFTSDKDKRTIGGTLELVQEQAQPKPKGQKGAKPAPAIPAAPKPKARQVALRVQFLDRAGVPVVLRDSAGVKITSRDTTVTVKPDEATKFELSATDSMVVGYKYAPIP